MTEIVCFSAVYYDYLELFKAQSVQDFPKKELLEN